MIIDTIFLISNIYWSIAFGYVLFRAFKHLYKFIKGYKNGQISNVKYNIQWFLYVLFPFFKRYIYPEKKK